MTHAARQRAIEQELAFVTRRLREGERTLASEPGGDLGDQAVRAEHRALTYGARESLLKRCRVLQRALERFADGSYGICTQCDHPINPRRLDVLPEAERCTPCQTALETLAASASRRARVDEEDA